MYFDKSMGKKKERMNMLKSMCSLMAACIIAIAALPAFAADDISTRNADFMNKLSLALLNKPADSTWLDIAIPFTNKGVVLGGTSETLPVVQVLLDSSTGTTYNNSPAFVDKVIENLYGRASGPDERNYWINELQSGYSAGQFVTYLIKNASPVDVAAMSAKLAAMTTDTPTTKTTPTTNFTASIDAPTTIVGSSGTATTNTAGVTPAATVGTTPSKAALGDALDLLKELTVDLKIEEEDKSDSYQAAQKRIDGQRGTLSTQLGKDISNPSALDKSVKELQERLANATTDEELKQIAAAILPLQTQTEIWVSNTGILGQVGKDTTQVTVQVDDAIKAINDRVIAGIQNVIRSKPVTCTTAYDPIAHAVVTRCN